MKRFFVLILIFSVFCLTGCTDIRNRRYAEIMQLSATDNRVELRCYDEKECWTANAGNVQSLPAALEQASGMKLAFGHLSLLIVTEEKLSALPVLLAKGILAPTCPVLLCDVPLSLEDHDSIAMQYDAAIRTGMLPRCTLGDIAGDFSYSPSTRTTLIPYWKENAFHLSVCDSSHMIALLSDDAQHGAVLLRNQFQEMHCINGKDDFTISKAHCQMHYSDEPDGITLHISAMIRTDAADKIAAEQVASRFLTAFFQEAVCTSDCDVCNLHETALRDGIPPQNAQQFSSHIIIVSCLAYPENRPLFPFVGGSFCIIQKQTHFRLYYTKTQSKWQAISVK